MTDPAPGAPLEAIAGRKRLAAERHERVAAELRAEAEALDAEARARHERRKLTELPA